MVMVVVVEVRMKARDNQGRGRESAMAFGLWPFNERLMADIGEVYKYHCLALWVHSTNPWFFRALVKRAVLASQSVCSQRPEGLNLGRNTY